jgi:hypothetical protein
MYFWIVGPMPFHSDLVNNVLQMFLDESSQHRLPPYRTKDDVIMD